MRNAVTVRGQKLADIAKRLIDHSVTVGVHKEEAAYPDGTRVQDVAAWNEYGTATIPERSFIRSTLANRRPKYFNAVKILAGNAIQGTDRIPLGMQRIGKLAQSDIKQTIVTIKTPPNSDATIAKKGRNDPLIDTRHLLGSIGVRDAK